MEKVKFMNEKIINKKFETKNPLSWAFGGFLGTNLVWFLFQSFFGFVSLCASINFA